MAKKFSKKKFLSIWIPCISAAAVLGTALEIVSANSYLSNVFDIYLGSGEIVKTKAEGTEDWDTEYYKEKLTSSDESKAAGEALTEEISNEGFVLLKNDGTLPVSTTKEITLLGRGSVDPVYGGSGSGNVDASKAATPRKGLEKAGFSVDSGAYDFYSGLDLSSYPKSTIKMDSYEQSQFFIGEIPTSKFTFQVKKDNVALVIVSRGGGEGGDLSTDLKRDLNTTAAKSLLDSNANAKSEASNYAEGQHQLELSKEEKDLIEFAKTNYSKVVVAINSSNAMELGDLEKDEKVSGIIWCGSAGSTGFNALGSILAGKVNPSGSLPDIYVDDLTKDPTFVNFSRNGIHAYTGIDSEGEIGQGDSKNYGYTAHFVEYEEGIYVGYKYYETASKEGFINYDDAVVYPFGYGLSYTTFEKELTKSEVKGDKVELEVRVKNTGNVAGKEEVQIYFTAPYTDGGIEKASTNLIDFGKTKELKSGEEVYLTFSINIEDMASYDYKVNKAYVLDKGTYTIEVKENSHEVTKFNGEEQSFSFKLDEKIYKDGRSSDKSFSGNQFDDVNAKFSDTPTTGKATNMSRSDFASTYPSTPTEADADPKTALGTYGTIEELLKPYSNKNNEEDTQPTIGASNGIQAADLRGLSYDDSTWDLLLDQLTEEDYTNSGTYLNTAAYNTKEIISIGKQATEDHDGPQGFSVLFGARPNACAYMSEPVLAATFNKELAKKMGETVGEEALQLGFTGWYGPAMNTHRSAFAGRNFEYYSEDGVLGGLIAAEVVKGSAEKGCVAYIKHFAVNDQEAFRTGNLCTWLNEQALREIYLKPFELAIKNSTITVNYTSDELGTVSQMEVKGAKAVMSSFNRIGTTWAGGSKALMTNVLRDEWGFEGVAESDFNLYGYMDPDQGMRAGTDLQLSFGGKDFTDTTSATARQAIRKAIKNATYMTVYSNVMNGVAAGTIITRKMSPWRIGTLSADIVLFTFALSGLAYVSYRMYKFKKEDDIQIEE